ncbi:MAG: lyase family protein, partial [Flavobacteriales bacterium]
MEYRIEKDTMGDVKVPAHVYWGAQTERSRNNFKIGEEGSMPREIIHAFAILKKAASHANHDLGVLAAEKRDAISAVCDEIIKGELADQFPLVIWQTGSGTQSNMNLNEVIANRAHVRAGGKLGEGQMLLGANDDVNKSQSSNDTYPTAMHVAAYKAVVESTLPGVKQLRDTLHAKSTAFMNVVKIGRTHLMDATPITLGQELSGYVAQLDHGMRALKNTLAHLGELALGGTAVGTGLNAPAGYSVLVAKKIAEFSGHPFTSAPNKF